MIFVNSYTFLKLIYSTIERPYSPTASGEDYIQMHEEDGKAADTIEYYYPEELPVDVGPTTDYELVESPTANGNGTQSELKLPPTSANPSYINWEVKKVEQTQ